MSEYDEVLCSSLKLKSGQGIKKKKKKHSKKIELEKRRDKRILESVLSKADKSHKQRIIEFNNYLSTLTEHFDIQKVSWTK
uniref:Protein FAM32A n=1 Tax=Trichobilharzia regenti TaxID=157069 RepID=A0AA85K368_TRIRE|nr:unnamed protein product [Trichobilharzia regenti]